MSPRGYLTIYRKFSTSQPLNDRIRVTVKAAFGKYLFLTNTVSCGVLMFLGDVIQQEIQYQSEAVHSSLSPNPERFNYGQMARMFVVGLAMGPPHHYYYKWLNMLWPARDTMTITKKILADQLVMSPICITQFFYTIGLLEKKTLAECNQELKKKFMPVYAMDWCIWPPTQFINFYLIPVKYQVLYINAVTMCYNVFLSYIKHYSDLSQIKAPKEQA